MILGRIALTRAVSPSLAACELTHVGRAPIDADRAARQHAVYERTLAELGCRVVRLPELPDRPDGVFVEDVVLVLDELAIVTRPGAASRRPETAGLEGDIDRWRPTVRIEAPATLDGGDVLRVGRTLFVGRSTRTNEAGREALERIAGPLGYTVRGVPVRGCLHLKSAATAVGDALLLVQPDWVDVSVFEGMACMTVDPAEPAAANVLRIGDHVMIPAAHERTRARLRAEGIRAVPVDVSELALAEGGVTCCSVIVEDRGVLQRPA